MNGRLAGPDSAPDAGNFLGWNYRWRVIGRVTGPSCGGAIEPEAIAAAGTPQMRRFKTAMKQATVLSR